MARGVRAGRAYVEIGTELGGLQDGLKAAQDKLSAFGTAIRGLGGKMMALSGAILAPLGASTKVAADFEREMAQVSTVLANPEAHMKSFTKGIRDMSVQMGEGTKTLSKGLYDILSASIAPEQAMNVLAVSAKAAKAGLTETGVAADAITTVLNAYGFSSDRASAVSDVLFKTVERGKITFEELAGQIGQTASLSATAGLSIQEVGGFIATLTRNGVQSGTAMTGLNAVIKSFLDPSDEAAKAAKKIGVEMSATTLKTRGLHGVFSDLSKLPPDVLAKLFPDIDALKAVLPAMRDLQAFGGDIQAISQSAGATEVAYKKMSATLDSSMTRLRESLTATFTLIGEALLPASKEFIDSLLPLLERAREWLTLHKDLIPNIAKTAVVIGVAGAALVVVGTVVSTLAVPLGAVATVLGLVATGFTTVTGVIGLLLGPIGLLAIAVYTSGRAFYGLVPTVRTAMASICAVLSDSWAAIGNVLRSGWDVIRALFSGGSISLYAAWRDFTINVGIAWSTLQSDLLAVWSIFMWVLRKTWLTLHAWLVDLWAQLEAKWDAFTTSVVNKIREPIATIRKWIRTHEEQLETIIKAIVAYRTLALAIGAATVATRALAMAFASVKIAIASVGAIVTTLLSPIGIILVGIVALGVAFYKWVPIVRWAVDTIKHYMGTTWTAIAYALRKAWDLMRAVWSGDTKAMNRAWEEFVKAVDVAWQWVKHSLAKAWDALVLLWERKGEVMGQAWASFKDLVVKAWDATQTLLISAWNYLGEMWAKRNNAMAIVWSGFKTAVKAIWDALWAVFDTYFKLIADEWEGNTTFMLDAWNLLMKGLRWALNKFKEFLISVWETIKPDFLRLVKYIQDVWTYALRDLRNAWNAFWDDVYSKAMSIPGMSFVLGGVSTRTRSSLLPDGRAAALLQQVSRQMAAIPSISQPGRFAFTPAAADHAASSDERVAAGIERMNRLLEKIDGRVNALGMTFR